VGSRASKGGRSNRPWSQQAGYTPPGRFLRLLGVEAPDLASRCSPRLAKAIYHAIKDKWSAVALIERHRAHKSSNVADVLAEHHHAWVRRELARAFANPEVERPKR